MADHRRRAASRQTTTRAILLVSLFLFSGALLSTLVNSSAMAGDFVAFETGPVRPMARSTDGSKLFVTNIPDGTLEIFRVANEGLMKIGSVRVGLEPSAVAVAPDGLVWVVNHLSDSVSLVDVQASPPHVVRTLLVGDEPRDIVFAGIGRTRAFITTAHRGQHRVDGSISGVPGAGDPQLTTPGVGRADVWVFESSSLGTTIGGTPIEIMTFFADTPRGLAVSPDGSTVYVAAFHSGNRSTTVPEPAVCDGHGAGAPCLAGGVLQLPGGVPGPGDNFAGAPAPETGVIIQVNPSSGLWEDALGRPWNAVVFSLPDHDVFAVNANSLFVQFADEFDTVGTILFNMAVNPVSGKVYVSNTELPNLTQFEGPGIWGGSTVQGRLSESRISVLSGTSTVDIRHLNKHIDYDQLHTDAGALHSAIDAQKPHSLATPVDMVVSSDGGTLYVAAYGSSKVGVFSTAELENDTFDPSVASAGYISTGGGPAGLVLDEARNRLYVATRFDNRVSVIDLSTRGTLQTVPLHNPEPPVVIEGRPFLYDAMATSGNGEASCASCHIFGDMDDIAWNLGNPDEVVTTNTQPSPANSGTSSFHPMKGPMTTQTLRGLATHGAHHWRGDRVDGHFGTDPCTDPAGSECEEERSFKNFIVAFEGLVGRHGILGETDMQTFTDFVFEILPPPNPVRNLDNSLTAQQQVGETAYFKPDTDGPLSCEFCHRLDGAEGFFGSGGGENNEGEPQNFKIPHLRNMYAKVGMFGMLANPDGTVEGLKGEQIRGFGFLHDGIVDTLEHFVEAGAFSLNDTEEKALEQYMFAFDADVAPVVGQQVTLDADNEAGVDPRIDLLKARAAASFTSLMLGGVVTECDLVAKGTVSGAPRGWVFDPGTGLFGDDQGGSWTDTDVRDLAVTDGPVTFTCVPPGSGERAGVNRDRDTLLDGLDNCPDADNDGQGDLDGDGAGDACDQDADGDLLIDLYETGTQTYVSDFETGSDPLDPDSDGDLVLDGIEVRAGTDPNDPLSFPLNEVPLLPLGGVVLLCGALATGAIRRVARRRDAVAG